MAGGILITTALDSNDDGAIQAGEVLSAATVCHGVDGLTSLINTSAEAAGANCANGGTRVDVGLDVNANNVLDAAEITNTAYICNGANGTDGEDGTDGTNGSDGADGTDGQPSILRLEAELGGPNCPYSGTRILSGIDDNEDGFLQDTEIDDEAIVCSTSPGDCAANYEQNSNGACVLPIVDAGIQGNGTVVDSDGLMWMQCVQGMTFEEETGTCVGTPNLLAYCTTYYGSCTGEVEYGHLNGGGASPAWNACHNLNYNGYEDWRVPTHNELSGLISCSNGFIPGGVGTYHYIEDQNTNYSDCSDGMGSYTQPTIDTTLFPDFPAGRVWSSKSRGFGGLGISGGAYTVNFTLGWLRDWDKDNGAMVICVR